MLTNVAVKKAANHKKPYKMFDTGGLFLHVMLRTKKWRMKYRYRGKEQLISFGDYPDVSLSEARKKRDCVRNLLDEGADPLAAHREEKKYTFETACHE